MAAVGWIDTADIHTKINVSRQRNDYSIHAYSEPASGAGNYTLHMV